MACDVKHNCWTCRHMEPMWWDGMLASCALCIPEDADVSAVHAWWDTLPDFKAVLDHPEHGPVHGMPPRGADGCPRWEAKEVC